MHQLGSFRNQSPCFKIAKAHVSYTLVTPRSAFTVGVCVARRVYGYSTSATREAYGSRLRISADGCERVPVLLGFTGLAMHAFNLELGKAPHRLCRTRQTRTSSNSHLVRAFVHGTVRGRTVPAQACCNALEVRRALEAMVRMPYRIRLHWIGM